MNNAKMDTTTQSNLKNILAGSEDNVLPTSEEMVTDDALSLIQQEVRQAGMKVEHGIEEHLLKTAIRWYVQRCGEAK